MLLHTTNTARACHRDATNIVTQHHRHTNIATPQHRHTNTPGSRPRANDAMLPALRGMGEALEKITNGRQNFQKPLF